MYQLAKETAQDAFQMAHRRGFNTELEWLQERIAFLDQLCEDTVCREQIKLLVDSSTSDSNSRFETIWNQLSKLIPVRFRIYERPTNLI